MFWTESMVVFYLLFGVILLWFEVFILCIWKLSGSFWSFWFICCVLSMFFGRDLQCLVTHLALCPRVHSYFSFFKRLFASFLLEVILKLSWLWKTVIEIPSFPMKIKVHFSFFLHSSTFPFSLYLTSYLIWQTRTKKLVHSYFLLGLHFRATTLLTQLGTAFSLFCHWDTPYFLSCYRISSPFQDSFLPLLLTLDQQVWGKLSWNK